MGGNYLNLRDMYKKWVSFMRMLSPVCGCLGFLAVLSVGVIYFPFVWFFFLSIFKGAVCLRYLFYLCILLTVLVSAGIAIIFLPVAAVFWV